MRMIATGNRDTGITEHRDRLSEGIIPSLRLPASGGTTDEWLLATYGRTFHFAARFLSPKHRHLVVILYAFFRTLDDLVDQPDKSRPIEDIRRELDAWKNWFTEGCTIPAPREPLGSRLAAVLAAHPVPSPVFLDFLDGLASDLEALEMCDFHDLYRYCYRVAGTVGLAMAHVLGVSSAQGLAAAQCLGIGMQLTNILRDVGGDLASGRIYLPREDLEGFGSSRAHLSQLYADRRGPDDRFRALMRYQIARAHRYYVHGMSGIWLLPPECRLPILIASRLYRRILLAIEQKNYDVLRSRAATSFPQKLREAAIAFTLNQLWRRGEDLASIEVEEFFED